MAVATIDEPRVIHVLVERVPQKHVEPTNWIDKIKYVAGIALALIGLGILAGATLALAGYFTGSTTIAIETIHPFFMTGIACSIGGFHMVKGGYAEPYAEISAGPLAVTI